MSQPGYELRDVRPAPVLAAGVALAALVVLIAWGVGALVEGIVRRADPGAPGHARHVDEMPPGPRLQAAPALELEEHRALEARRTGEYAWIDREAGVVRVPVERAMELILERGLPTRAGPGSDPGGEGGR